MSSRKKPLSKAAAVDAPMDSLADLASTSPPVARTPSQKKKKPKKDSTATPTATSSAAKKKSSQTPSGSSKAKKKSSQTPSGSSSSAAKKKSSQTPSSSSKAKAKPSQTPSNSSTEAKPNQTPKSSTVKAKPSQTPSSSGKSSKTYTDMIHEAIVALQDRTGSSVPAIKKYMLAEFPTVDGPHFKNRFATGLKSGIKTERFVKLKCSYKISAAFRNKLKAKRKKVAAQAKRKSLSLTVEQRNKQRMEALQKKDLTPEELAKAKADMAAKVAAEKRRQALERQQRERAERIRRRRFPMEDHKLHLEDKELNVKPPPDVTSRPHLPWFWHMTLPLEDPARKGKTSDSVLRHSKVENADVATRGLVPDLLQVYHFFSGDVNFSSVVSEDETLVAPCRLQHLVFAVDEIIQGNTKKSRLIPPLISHLFTVCLQFLCQEPAGSSAPDDDEVEVGWFHFRKELANYLLPALTPASWPDICFLYMDAMERFYSTDASTNPNSLAPMSTDLGYLLGQTDERSSMNEALPALPAGYGAYLGSFDGTLAKAHEKLGRQDAWLLTAEELMSLLRALTDDVLGSQPDIVTDMTSREEEAALLLKARREADNKFRKVRLAFEGPKKKRAAATTVTATTTSSSEKKEGEKTENAGANGELPVVDPEPVFKPTATRKQFEVAQKAQVKAHDAYEKGLRRLVARTEPIGVDRNFNAVYYFRHDAEVLYIEDCRPPGKIDESLPADLQQERRSWHVIENTALFDMFTSSLDIRGRRENALYEELMGATPSQSLRRYLYDDMKDANEAAARAKEKENLKRKLDIAKIKCDEEQGRRSGRLADQAEIELAMLQEEMEKMDKEPKTDLVKPPRDYVELTGIALLQNFENAGKVETRRTREKKESAAGRPIPLIRCGKMVPTGHIDGSGIVGQLASLMLETEERCEKLAPLDSARESWINRLEELVHSWYTISPVQLGPNHSNVASETLSSPEAKRRKRESMDAMSPGAGASSVSSILSQLRQSLLDLEKRVAELTNIAQATHDADVADDNMSVEDHDEQDTETIEKAWKKKVDLIRSMPAKKHVQVRDALVAAIAAARKAHLPDVVSELRAALLLYHPNAAKDCKDAAVEVLLKHGDYDRSDDDDDDEEIEAEDSSEEKEEKEEVSVLSTEAVTLRSCLGGSDDATRADWVDAVKACKTLSRLGALSAAFCSDANKRLKQINVDRENLLAALPVWDREVKSRKKSKSKIAASEVWANVRLTDEICMARGEGFSWWPARRCEAKDRSLTASLDGVDRCLVALFGEMGGIRVVIKDEVVPFDGDVPAADEDDAPFTKEIRGQFDDNMAMARRILRSLKKRKKK